MKKKKIKDFGKNLAKTMNKWAEQKEREILAMEKERIVVDAFWAMVDKFQKEWGVDLKINLEEVELLIDNKMKNGRKKLCRGNK